MAMSRWLGRGFSLSLAGVAAAAQLSSACGGDDAPTSPASTPDASTPIESGVDAGGGVGDSGSDAGADSAVEPSGPYPFISFLHDSLDTEGVTPCFATASKIVVNPATADSNVVAPLRGKPMVMAANRGPLMATDEVSLYLIPSSSKRACDDQITKLEGIDGVKKFQTWPAGTFERDKSYIVMLLGCTKDAKFDETPWCYADWDGQNVGGGVTAAKRIEIVEVDTEFKGDGGVGIGVQFIQANPFIQYNGGNFDGPMTALKVNAVGNGNGSVLTGYTGYAGAGSAPQVSPPTAQHLVLGDDNYVDLYKDNGGTPALVGGVIQRTFSAIVQTTTGAASATYIQNGKNYVFIFLGAELDPSTGFYIALPTRW